MSTDPLEHLLARVARAREHAETLDALVDSWIKKDSRPTIEIRVENELEIVTVSVPEAPPILSILLGEVAHNARSFLDHLVHAVIETQCGSAHGYNYFPIAANEADFKRLTTSVTRNSKQFRGALHPLPAHHGAFRAVRAHQPYVGSDPGHPVDVRPMYLLNRVWNIDKHRHPLRVELGGPDTPEQLADMFEWDRDAPLIEAQVNLALVHGTYANGAELARFRFADVHTKPYVRVKGHMPADVMLGYNSPQTFDVRFAQKVPQLFVDAAEAVMHDLHAYL